MVRLMVVGLGQGRIKVKLIPNNSPEYLGTAYLRTIMEDKHGYFIIINNNRYNIKSLALGSVWDVN